MVVAGLGAGAILSIWAVRALRGVIVMSGASDLSTIGATVAVLVVTGLGAVLPAALRAARTDPMSALRSE
jgi:ABC-type antimicrobial peptide transport system permease subunit